MDVPDGQSRLRNDRYRLSTLGGDLIECEAARFEHRPFPGERLPAFHRHVDISRVELDGLIRRRARKSSPLVADGGERSLDCVGHQSGHANSET